MAADNVCQCWYSWIMFEEGEPSEASWRELAPAGPDSGLLGAMLSSLATPAFPGSDVTSFVDLVNADEALDIAVATEKWLRSAKPCRCAPWHRSAASAPVRIRDGSSTNSPRTKWLRRCV